MDLRRDELALRLAGRLLKLDLELANRLDLLVRGFERFEDGLLGDFLGAASTIRIGVGRAGDDQIEVGVGHLGHRRVDDDLAADQPDANGADGAVERDVRDGQRGRGADDRADGGSFAWSAAST